MDPTLATINLHIASLLTDLHQAVRTEKRLALPLTYPEAVVWVLGAPSVAAFNRTLTMGGGVVYARPARSHRGGGHVPVLRCSIARIAAALVEMGQREAGDEAWWRARLARQRPQILCCAYDRVRDQVCGAKAAVASTPALVYVYCRHHARLFDPAAPAVPPHKPAEDETTTDWSTSLF